jgi:hypothetical protein
LPENTEVPARKGQCYFKIVSEECPREGREENVGRHIWDAIFRLLDSRNTEKLERDQKCDRKRFMSEIREKSYKNDCTRCN